MNYLPTTLPSSHLANLLGKGGLAGIDLFKREILVLKCITAGLPFYNLFYVEEQLTTYATVRLEREPDNKYDEMAIKVLANDIHIGYIPRDRNEVVARLMDAGKTFTAKVVCIDLDSNPTVVEIEVFLKD